MSQKILIAILALTYITICVRISMAYDSYNVHPKINEAASRQAKNLTISLKGLNLNDGVETTVHGKALYKWFRGGGTLEDFPIYRANNHFHDPIDNSGLKGSWFGIPSLLWAYDQAQLGPAAGGDWSWKKARDLYYEALTAPYKSSRERAFADTFNSLGQVMHLLADSSVPAHTRNDIHVFPYEAFGTELGKRWQTYESWAKRNYDKLNYDGLFVNPSVLKSNNVTTIPISALWDQDKYTGADVTVAVGTGLGLAEYTNANFFSEDTIFKNYPHPAFEDTNYGLAFRYPETVDAEDGKLDNRAYIRKTVGEADARLAAFSYISYDVLKKGYYEFAPFVLDDKVYNDYSALLVPRAVGYSAGLLDYFFRGDSDVNVCHRIVNNSDEDMVGRFELYYDNIYDERVKKWGAFLNLRAKESSNVISLAPPANAKEKNKYLLVFRGRLGNEENAATGKSVTIKPNVANYSLGKQTILGESESNGSESSYHVQVEHYIQSADETNPDSVQKVIIGIDDRYSYERLSADGEYVEKHYYKDIAHDIEAVFSYDKALFLKSEFTDDVNRSHQMLEEDNNTYCCWVTSDATNIQEPNTISLIIGNDNQQVLLESRGGLLSFTDNVTEWAWKVAPSPHAGSYAKAISQSKGGGKRYYIDIMAQDHACSDENVILFYKIQENDITSSYSVDMVAGEIPEETIYEKNVTTETYYLWYKINKLVQKIELPAVFTDLTVIDSQYPVATHEKTGQRILGASCQIYDTKMDYSYYIFRYENEDVIFEKGIAGTINISDKSLPIGYRQESEFYSY